MTDRNGRNQVMRYDTKKYVRDKTVKFDENGSHHGEGGHNHEGVTEQQMALLFMLDEDNGGQVFDNRDSARMGQYVVG